MIAALFAAITSPLASKNNTMMRLQRGFRLLTIATMVLTTHMHAIIAPSISKSIHSMHIVSSSLRSAATNEVINQTEERDDATTSKGVHIPGTRDGFIITKTYDVPLDGFPSLSSVFEPRDEEILQLEVMNVTLPAALMLLDPEKYPTQSRARKAIRQKAICICRNNADSKFDELGKVIARAYPGDVLGYQQRGGTDYYAIQGTPFRLPSFDVPVVYEDDHMAIVNKPAGIVSYRAEGGRGGGARGGHGRDTLLSALPSVLTPSKIPISDENYPMKRPQPVHRLDRPTSGIVVVGKTKAAVVHLSQQFEFRKAQKTYMAILNGIPQQPSSDKTTKDGWNLIDCDLEDKSAITQWKVLQTVKSLHGNNGVLTLVEMKPKTGRYHQLRRHMAWVCKAPIVGDATYDEDNLRLRRRGLFLCSNEIMIEHPYYNTPSGREEWSQLKQGTLNLDEGCLLEEDEETGTVTLRARIDLPNKFESFLMHEDARAIKFRNE